MTTQFSVTHYAVARHKVASCLYPRRLMMSYLLLLKHIAGRVLRREYMIQGHADLFVVNDEYLLGHFRSPRVLLMEICNTLELALLSQATRSNPTTHSGTTHLGLFNQLVPVVQLQCEHGINGVYTETESCLQCRIK